jgi:putative pyruvate formate lyase activating enzyme
MKSDNPETSVFQRRSLSLEEAEDLFRECRLCPRECGVDRLLDRKGYCGMSSRMFAARAALHMWEEPCISGQRGSGAVFFSGCGLKCCFCQNREIAIGDCGLEISTERLADIFLELEQKGAANLNLVTGAHFVPQILLALESARKRGFALPVVYNSSGYEKVETLRMMNGYVDVYLPDLKYREKKLAESFSHAGDYFERAAAAIREMVSQTGDCVFDKNGYLLRGTIVRHLVLPGHTKNSIAVLEYLYQTYGDHIYISIMNQYTPVVFQKEFLELNRKVTAREYQKVLDAAIGLGIEQGFFQEGETAKESFIPLFDYEGIRL